MGKTLHSKSRVNSENLRVITLLNLGYVTLHPFTTNQAAHDYLVGLMPKGVTCKIPTCSTVNRSLKKAGDIYEIPTPIGLYTLKKAMLLMKGK